MNPDRLSYSAANCSIAGTLQIVGEKWSLLVLREAFYGLRRYEEFLEVLGCARNILGSRLATLVEHEVLMRVSYRDEGQRERFEYRLTAKGLELLPVLLALMQWGDRWLATERKAPVLVSHAGCGTAVKVELRCAEGHGPLGAHDTRATPGPGARRKKGRG